MRLFLEILLGGFAAFGMLCAFSVTLDALLSSGLLTVAVTVPDREARQNLEDLLACARGVTFKRSGTRLIVLFYGDAMDEDMALSPEEAELLSRYGADYYRIGS